MPIRDKILKLIDSLPDERLSELEEILNTWLQDQKRQHARRTVSKQVDMVIQDQARVHQRELKNISAGGVFINIKGKFEPGSEARLVFSLSESEKPLKLTGHIVRFEDAGIAIQFDNNTPYFQAFLDEQIWKE